MTLLLGASGSATLIAAGYDPAYGARPLRRLVEKAVLTEISKLLLGGQIPDNSVVTINGAADGRLVVSTTPFGGKSCQTCASCLLHRLGSASSRVTTKRRRGASRVRTCRVARGRGPQLSRTEASIPPSNVAV